MAILKVVYIVGMADFTIRAKYNPYLKSTNDCLIFGNENNFDMFQIYCHCRTDS